jgi:serine/threonine protein kinase
MALGPDGATWIAIGAAGKAAPAERAAYLDEACGGDAGLRGRVEELLTAHQELRSRRGPPAAEPARAVAPPDNSPGRPVPTPLAEVPGSQIGPYKLLQQLGEGGMGAVWVAEQTQPVKRRVAVKVIKPGMDSAHVIRRFEAERQALTMMDHANIARVLDAGTTGAGRPYFVMELVKGVPITKYCDEQQLSLRDRLALFVPVCQAIQHAHQKGIIHRDIKPSNVLVAMQDGRPVPKVIDFGLAKALHQRLTDESMYTEIGAVLGTLEYMSPEQAELNPLDIDTRTDVYALGVLLYELLTGTTPLDRKGLRQAAYAELLRLIREVEPPKPSTRLTASKDALPGVAAKRRTEPVRLAKAVRGELDWIVMKALEKDRTRRYETATGLARDVEHYLSDEPVEACPPSASYRLRKFARKNRRLLATATAFAGLLVLGAAGSAWQAVRATSAEREAKASANEAKAVLSFFKDTVLAAGRPEGQDGGLGKDVTVRQAVDAAAPGVAAAFEAQPLVEASVRAVMGQTYYLLGESPLAVPQFERALTLRQANLGPVHRATLESMNDLAKAYHAAGKRDLALPLYEETLKLRQTHLGPEDPDTLTSMNNLGLAHLAAGKHDLAVSLLEKTLKLRQATLGPGHAHTLGTMNNLASANYAAGKRDLALLQYEEALKATKAELGPEHPETLTSMNNLATAYHKAGKLDLALALYQDTLKLRQAKLGPEASQTLISMNNLAAAYQDTGRLDLALPLFQKTLELRRARLRPDHPDTLSSMNNLAAAYQDAGRLDLALPLFEKTLALQQVHLAPEHKDTLKTMNSLASAYQEAGKAELALPLFERTLALRQVHLGPEHPDTLGTMNDFAAAYKDAGKLDLALPLFEKTLTLRQAGLGKEHPETLITMFYLGETYDAARKYAEAVSRFQALLAIQRRTAPAEDPALADTLDGLGQCLVHAGKPAAAEPLLREGLAIRQKKQPDLWTTFDTQSALGGVLLGQKRFADAEPLLRTGYDGMKRRAAKIPAAFKVRLAHARDRLAKLYDALGQTQKADAVRNDSAEAKPPGDG